MQTAKLFKNGRSQAVRLPKEFRFEGGEVVCEARSRGGVVLLSKSDPWASIAEAYALADPQSIRSGGTRRRRKSGRSSGPDPRARHRHLHRGDTAPLRAVAATPARALA